MKKLFKKISVFLKMIRTYQNWFVLTLYRLNLRPAPLTVIVRGGAKFKVRDRRTELSDAYVVNECYLYGVHESLLSYIKSAKIGFDVGAHIGSFSIFAAENSPATIHCFEPTPKNLETLKENIRLNNLEARVIPVGKALTSKTGFINIFIPENGGLATTLKSHLELCGLDPSTKTLKVPAITLADYMRDHNIEFCDFIKMDCEGNEYDILYNLPPEIFKKIGVMSIEYHRDGDVNELTEFLKKNNFQITRPKNEFAEIFCVNRSLLNITS